MADYNNIFPVGYNNKTETTLSYGLNDKFSNMKPIYSTDENLMCGVIEYNNKRYLLDLNDKDRIINFNKKFVYKNENYIYP